MPTAPDHPTLSGEMFIGSLRVRGDSGTVQAENPRTGRTLQPTYGLGGSDHAAEAARLAAEAFATYRATAPTDRAAFLDTLAANLEADELLIVDRVEQETGIPQARAALELARTTHQLRLFAQVVRDGGWARPRVDPAQPERQPTPRADIRQRRIPLGPVAVFGSSNFPLAFSVAGGDTAAALAAGCPVVVKAHNAHPGTSELVALAVRRAVVAHGLHEGTFSMLFGSGRELGVALVADPRIRAVGFTGSRAGGMALMDVAARRPVPIPVFAEMSSINPVILLPAALRDRATQLAGGFVSSLTLGVGQFCTNPGLILGVESTDLDRFIAAAASALSRISAQPMLSRDILEAYRRGIGTLDTTEGVTREATGRPDDNIALAEPAALFSTTSAIFMANRGLQEEVFGAAALVVRVATAGELAPILALLDGQLTSTLHAEPADYSLTAQLLPLLETKAGRIIANGWPTGVEVGHAMVHGGPYPATSDGRSSSVGTLSIERFTRPVAYQDVPDPLLPDVLADRHPLGTWRLVDGVIRQV